MNDRTSIEITGDSVDDAVAKGLATLNAGPGDVIVEILEEPSRGVFGIGARPAKVRLQLIRRAPPPTPPAPVPPPAAAPKEVSPAEAPTEQGENRESGRGEREQRSRGRDHDRKREARDGDRNGNDRNGGGNSADRNRRQGDRNAARPQNPARDRGERDEYEYNEEEEAFAFAEQQGDAAGEDGDVSKGVLLELLRGMGIKAEVQVTRAASTQPDENPPWLLNVEGREVSSLIGRRGETLSSLQYITRLISSRLLGRRANIVVDVGSYKLRRSQKLRELAVRMADQAVSEARTVVLEPMPPHERRMIHMALRHRTDVSTRSTGEGDARKVTIVPTPGPGGSSR